MATVEARTLTEFDRIEVFKIATRGFVHHHAEAIANGIKDA